MSVLQKEPLFLVSASTRPFGFGRPIVEVKIRSGSGRWLTPGGHIQQAIAGRPEVRLIVERLDKDRYSVFVVLDRDPEDLLDAIFDAEKDLYARPRGIPFDVRVMCPGPDWSDLDLKADSICHYDRTDFDGRG